MADIDAGAREGSSAKSVEAGFVEETAFDLRSDPCQMYA